jgi:ankyrin repeat protein
MCACAKGNKEAAEVLVAAGANYIIKTESGSPLILAIESGNIELVKYLRSLPNCPNFNEGD